MTLPATHRCIPSCVFSRNSNIFGALDISLWEWFHWISLFFSADFKPDWGSIPSLLIFDWYETPLSILDKGLSLSLALNHDSQAHMSVPSLYLEFHFTREPAWHTAPEDGMPLPPKHGVSLKPSQDCPSTENGSMIFLRQVGVPSLWLSSILKFLHLLNHNIPQALHKKQLVSCLLVAFASLHWHYYFESSFSSFTFFSLVSIT